MKKTILSPTQQSVNTLWAYIFLCTDEQTSSNAVLSLQICIRNEPTALKVSTRQNSFDSSENNYEGGKGRRSTCSDIALLCDACPVRDFNSICSQLIDLKSDEERITFLSSYINRAMPVENDNYTIANHKLSTLKDADVQFIKQFLPKQAVTSKHALVCDVVFALFQMTEYNRINHHSHVFADDNEQKEQKKMSTTLNFAKKILPSEANNTSFVEQLRKKLNTTSRRRGSVSGLFSLGNSSTADETETDNSNNNTIRNESNQPDEIDLLKFVKETPLHAKHHNQEQTADVTKDYVIVPDVEVNKAMSPLLGKPQVSTISVTPKSNFKQPSTNQLLVPGSEPCLRLYSRRSTVANVPMRHSTFRTASVTPLAKFEQYPEQTPHRNSVSITTPQYQRMFSSNVSMLSSRRRSIFELVMCPPIGNQNTHSSNHLDIFDPSSQSVPKAAEDFPSVVEPDTKQLDYDEPLGGCSAKTTEGWLKIIGTRPQITKEQNEYLESLLVDGVPKQLRGKVWSWLVRREISLLSRKTENIPNVSPTEYEDLLSSLTPCNQQILMDLSRTFPNHSYFAQHFGAGQLSLFNILKAYSLIDPEVGYCQGISFVAGILLMHCASEYDAFTLLLQLMFGFGLRTVYLPSMDGLHRCLYQLTRLLDCQLPATFEHLTSADVVPMFFASPWFVTIFASQFPLGFTVRVFGMFNT